MNRRTTDLVVGGLLVALLLVGGVTAWQSWQATLQTNEMMGTMMGSGMMNTGPNPLWTLFGTVAVVVLVGVGYLSIRDGVTVDGATGFDEEVDPSSTESTETDATGSRATNGGRSQLLDILPEDERRILEPVIESPGLTQIELRDRSDFSKSKVSQTVSDLEKRGLLFRERQGRTYRVYPADDVADA